MKGVKSPPAIRRVVFHVSPSHGGIESWINDFLMFGGGEYVVISSHSLGHEANSQGRKIRTRFASRQLMIHHIESFMMRGTARKKNIYLVFNLQSAVRLLFIVPRAKFIYVSCNNFGAQRPLMSPLRRRVFPRLEKLVLRKAQFVFSMSSVDARRIGELRPDVQTIASSFNDRLFFPPSHPSDERHGVLWIGRLVELKDPLLAISAFENSAERHAEDLTIIGEGQLEERIRARIISSPYRGRIRLKGRLLPQELAQTMRSARLALITSKTEAAPRTVLEFLASGTPVVATAESDPDNWVLISQSGDISHDRDAASLGFLICKHLEKKREVDGDLLASAKASYVMPQIESRLSELADLQPG